VRKWTIVALILVVLAVAGFYAMRMLSPAPADLDVAREKISAAGTYAVAIEPEVEPIQQGSLHAWIVTVKTPDGEPVSDAEIIVGGGMPQHGHGLPTAPQSTGHVGEGRYRIDGVRFNMGGWWVLKFAISAPAGDDEAEFNIVL
jgi:hypothetical protein